MQPEGTGANRIYVLAEALGEHEERECLPLRPQAPTGSIFDYIIRSQGWNRDQFLLGNTIWCRPGPKNFLKGASYEYEAIEHCQVHNDRLIAERRPKVLLALGDIAMRTLTGHTGKKQGISLLRGFILHSQKYDLPVIATWHPSYLIGRADEQVEKGSGGGGGKKHLGTVARDIALALRIAEKGLPPPDQTEYVTNPSVEQARAYFTEVLAHPEWVISTDIENPKTQAEDEQELKYESAPIIQIQFSHRTGWGIAFPWVDPYIGIAKQILATANIKVGHNIWQYDIPVLREHNVPVNGQVHDTQWLWHSLQPDLPRGLQFMTSFYAPNMRPWKHTAANLAEYGCADVDAPLRCLPNLLKDLDGRGVRGSYEQKSALVPITDYVSANGLPVDRERQSAYAEKTRNAMQALVNECQGLIPMSVRGIHPKQGYRTLSAKLKALVAEYDETHPPLIELAATSGHLMKLDDERWCLRELFNPNSRDQLLKYIQHRRDLDIAERLRKGYDKSKAERTTLWKLPTKRNGKLSTGNLELTPLVKKTQDRVLLIAQKYRELDKGLDFASGAWVPGPDGRVHPKFSFGTSTGQMTASNPNSQQLVKHNEQGETVRQFIRAPEGYVFIAFDFVGFHALMVGLLARDPTYMRMARFGVHDFVVAHMMKLPHANSLSGLPDTDLKVALKDIKVRYKPERSKAKRCIAEGQLVLTNNGLKPIEKVLLADRVWDGVEWVTHDGVEYQGEREVITHDGLTATPDQEVFTAEGRQVPLWLAASTQDRLAPTAIEGHAVRAFDHPLSPSSLAGWLSIRESALCLDGYCALDMVGPNSQRQAGFLLPQWQTARPAQGSAGQALRLHCTTLPESKRFGLQTLWWAWDRVSYEAGRIRQLCNGTPAARQLQRGRNRPQEQQWPLRSWQLALGYSPRAEVKHAHYGMDYFSWREASGRRVAQSLHEILDAKIGPTRADYWRTNNRTGETGNPLEAQTLAQDPGTPPRVRVYDILNAGPRQRYTVSGKLVHNCVHGVNFGEGAYKLHQVHSDLFGSRAEAQGIITLIFQLFPRLKQWQDEVRWQAHNDPKKRLLTPHGYHRYFYDVWRAGGRMAGESSEECIAYKPANYAHGHYREKLIDLWSMGLIGKYGACNLVHDEVLFLVKEEMQHECVAEVQPVLQSTSKVIFDDELAPDGLWVGVDAAVGKNWGEYHSERNPDGMQ